MFNSKKIKYLERRIESLSNEVFSLTLKIKQIEPEVFGRNSLSYMDSNTHSRLIEELSLRKICRVLFKKLNLRLTEIPHEVLAVIKEKTNE